MRFVGWLAYYAARVLTKLVGALMWRMETHGKENIPVSGPFLLCPVHRSNADGPITCTFTRRRMRYFAKHELFKIHWLGRLFHHMGAIPVNRDAPGRESLKTCLDVLGAGHPLVLFPEGGRRSGPEVHKIQDGAAYLALKAGVPIVPVGIEGSEFAQPAGKTRLSFHKVRIVIGEPFMLAPGERSTTSRTAMREGTEMIHERLQSVFDQAMGNSVRDDK